jgi:hypothetical protein
MPDLKERYEDVHAAILDGPNAELQELIDSGLAWRLEGFTGRMAMAALTDGACVLPDEVHSDYWGSSVPSYKVVKDEVGSPGSVANAEAYRDDQEYSPFYGVEEENA